MSRTFHRSKNDPAKIETGIVHLGFGAFHRAHQAEYLDRHIERTGDARWGVMPINLRGADRANFLAAAKTDGYILRRLNHEGHTDDRLVRCHTGFLDWSDDADSAVAALSQANVKAVTMTVTEAGYNLDGKGLLNLDDAQIAAEMRGEMGSSVYAFLTAALKRRADVLGDPISLLNCDNIRRNGHMLERNLNLYFDAMNESDLKAWVAQNVTFPSSMVDRITPQPSPAHHAQAMELYGEHGDLGPTIHAEDFIQWVIEDKFATDFPDMQPDGVTFTPDVDPYEETKIRVLNGGHTALAYLGALEGFLNFDEVMKNPETATHFERFESEEVTRALPESLPFDVEEYVATVSRRFSNQHIADSVERIVSDGFAKFPQFIRPTVRGCLEQGHVPEHAFRSIASWFHFTRKSLEGNMSIPYREPNIKVLTPLVESEEIFVDSELLWGDLGEKYPLFKSELSKAIRQFEA